MISSNGRNIGEEMNIREIKSMTINEYIVLALIILGPVISFFVWWSLLMYSLHYWIG